MDRFIFTTKVDKEESTDYPTALPADVVQAMAYVPLQFLGEVLNNEEGFKEGTIFPTLLKPLRAGSESS